jgi:hypothetical protein
MTLIGAELMAVKMFVVDVDNSVDRSAGTGVDAIDPAADDNGILVVLETSGSGNRKMPSVLMQ